VNLREARPEDVSGLVTLEREAFGPAAWSEASLRSELAGVPRTRHVVVAEDESGLVGYGVLLAVGDTADVTRLVVAPDRRRQGTGRRLLTALLAAARDRGCTAVLLEVAADNTAARALYGAARFEVVATRRGYYGPGRDAVVMSLPIRPVRGAGASTG